MPDPPPPPGPFAQSAPADVELPVELDWLIGVINEKCNDADGKVISHEAKRIGVGKGFMSHVTRVIFKWDPQSKGFENLPGGVIIKIPTDENIPKLDSSAFEMFTRDFFMTVHNQECNAYEFLNKYPPVPIPMAKCFHAKRATQDDFGMLILEDLTDSCVSLQFMEDASIAHVKEIAHQVACLQAYGFQHRDDLKEYFKQYANSPFEPMLKDFDNKIDELRGQVGPERLKYSNEELRAIFDGAKAKLDMFQDPSKFGFTPVISLGDVQPNNLLWKRDAEGKASPRLGAIIDFQLSHIGNCMNDIAFTITNCLPTSERRAHQDAIVDHYLASLASHGDSSAALISKSEAIECRRLLSIQFAITGMLMQPMLKQILVMNGIDESAFDTSFDRIMNALEDYKLEATKM